MDSDVPVAGPLRGPCRGRDCELENTVGEDSCMESGEEKMFRCH